MTTRSLCAIARDITTDWKRPAPGAIPYLAAMRCLNSIEDKYALESGASIVRYFLANASTWRGPVAQAVKKELNAMLAP